MRILKVGWHINVKIPVVRIWCDDERLNDVSTVPQAFHEIHEITIPIYNGVDALHCLIIG